MFFIIAGVVLGVVLFIAITETTVFGMSCYHFGRFDINTFCLNPPVYKGGFAVAAALVVLGVVLMLRKQFAPRA